MTFARTFIYLMAILVACSSAIAQTQPNLENGFKAYGSYGGGGIDSVNLMNGNLTVQIPMPFNYSQRGDLASQMLLSFSSKAWLVAGGSSEMPFWSFNIGRIANVGQIGEGISLSNTSDLALHRIYLLSTDSNTICGNNSTWGHYLTTWDGAVHQLTSAANAPADCTGAPLSFDAVDNSGYHVELNNIDPKTGVPGGGVIIDRQGRRYQFREFSNDCLKAQANQVQIGRASCRERV